MTNIETCIKNSHETVQRTLAFQKPNTGNRIVRASARLCKKLGDINLKSRYDEGRGLVVFEGFPFGELTLHYGREQITPRGSYEYAFLRAEARENPTDKHQFALSTSKIESVLEKMRDHLEQLVNYDQSL